MDFQSPSDFKDLAAAESAINDQVMAISDQYIQAIKKILPTLKRSSSEQRLTQRDRSTFLTLYNEANDHLHNLVQLKEEVRSYGDSEQGLVMELSSEVLAKVVKFLAHITKTIGATNLYNNDPT
jgi:hypothetical protein